MNSPNPIISCSPVSVWGKRAGFTLIELMIVVGVIGILVNISISSFSKYQAKARQSEAKLALSSIFSLEKSFYAEYGSYIADFDAIGFSPEGNRRFYAVGWPGSTVSGNITGYSASAGISYYGPLNSPAGVCAIPCPNWTTQATWCWTGTPVPGGIDPQAFWVFAFGQIDHLNICGQGDGWSIDNLRILQNSPIGL